VLSLLSWLVSIPFWGLVALACFVWSVVIRWRAGDQGLTKEQIDEYLDKTLAQRLSVAVFIWLIGLIAIRLPVWLVAHPDTVLQWLKEPIAVVPALMVGIALFWFRCKRLFEYALIEIGGAVGSTFYAIIAPNNSLLAKGLGILGGLYILVRGLDNIDKSLKNRSWWDRIFYKSQVPTGLPASTTPSSPPSS
jgi:hypothetical protein